eukprot:scaffold224599_cov19-Prasinocladus_malaysianus.AAC.1
MPDGCLPRDRPGARPGPHTRARWAVSLPETIYTVFERGRHFTSYEVARTKIPAPSSLTCTSSD